MGQRSNNKDALAICGRSGIETLKSKLVRDGYMRGLWVLPEYYEPPEPIKYRPKPEIPPFNPQPLIDIFLTTYTMNTTPEFADGQAGPVPFCLTAVGKFELIIDKVLLPADICYTSVGEFSFLGDSYLTLSGVESSTATGTFGGGVGYGLGGYGENVYGGEQVPGFGVGFFMVGQQVISATGEFGEEEGYGNDVYGEGTYGG